MGVSSKLISILNVTTEDNARIWWEICEPYETRGVNDRQFVKRGQKILITVHRRGPRMEK